MAVAGKSTFDYSDTTRAAPQAKWSVHETLDPKLVNGPASPLAGQNIRESRDSDEHPNSVAVSVLFDVTGSMHGIPMELQKRLPNLLELLLYKQYVEDPQILFGAIGDATCDKVPLQIAQFESDNRLDTHLGNIFLERGGGGGGTESYELGMYFMARHTALDCVEKRDHKGYCNTPDAPIWMADQTFREIGKVGIGDEVMGWTHENGHRSLTTATVVAVQRRFADNVVEVTMESGRVIRCTRDHKWLSSHHGKSGKDVWTNVVNRYGQMSTLSHVVTPVPPLPEYLREDAAWLAGVYDGEGFENTISQYRSHNPGVCDRIAATLDRIGFEWSEHDDAFHVLGGMQAYIEMLNWLPITRREQLLNKILFSKWSKYQHGEQRATALNRRPDRIVEIRDLPPQEVISMQTTTGNYTAWGYASSNCFMIGDEKAYPQVKAREVRKVIGDDLDENISTEAIIREVQEKYNFYFIIPQGGSHSSADWLKDYWTELMGQNVIMLDDPSSVAEFVALQVGIAEETIDLAKGLKDLKEKGASDSTMKSVTAALDV